MKKFLILFYTVPVKVIIMVMIVLTCWNIGSVTLHFLTLYRNDHQAFTNVFVQGNSFDYSESYFLEAEIMVTISSIAEYTLKYSDNEQKRENALKEDSQYKQTADFLKSLSDIRYAVVNHSTKKIYSNIDELNERSSKNSLSSFFEETDSTLIVLNAKNPSFVPGAMDKYVETVKYCSEKYPCDFDMYVSFPESFEFRYTVEDYEARHQKMSCSIKATFLQFCVFALFLILLYTISYIVTGQHEPKGKCYYSVFDRIPNDTKLLLYIINIASLVALIETSLYMIFLSEVATKNDLMAYSPEFYTMRAKLGITLIGITLTDFICSFKRHRKNGSLLSKTYIFRMIKNYRKVNPTEDNE